MLPRVWRPAGERGRRKNAVAAGRSARGRCSGARLQAGLGVSGKMTHRRLRNHQRAWHFVPRINISDNFTTIVRRMIDGAFLRLKTKTIADSPHYWADRIDVREAVIFHPHQIKQRACRRIRGNYAVHGQFGPSLQGAGPAQEARASLPLDGAHGKPRNCR